MEIAPAQVRQRPRKIIQDATGTISNHAMRLAQDGQADRPLSHWVSLRTITTLRKLPTQRPKSNANRTIMGGSPGGPRVMRDACQTVSQAWHKCDQRPCAAPLPRCAERPQILGHLCLPAMNRPAERCALPDSVLDIQPRASLHQEAHHRLVTG